MSTVRNRLRFSVSRYEQLIDAGILTENDPVELIRGEILEKLPAGVQHASCIKRLNHKFSEVFGQQITIGVQDPIRLTDSEPEPDLILLKPRDGFYANDTPIPADVLLIVEVADSTLDYDRDVKLRLYAENRIVEYWVVNLLDHRLEVYRQPLAVGSYRHVQMLGAGDQIAIQSLPGPTFSVADMF
jgi:hypothetical protein